jgi:CRP/FNR family cyclic AMP-dependent transcriptional regulator
MERIRHIASHVKGFFSGPSLGGRIFRYGGNQNIYTQGEPADTLFFIQEGGVRLTTRTKTQPSAVTAILGVNDFFGELCLAGYPLRMSTAITLTASSIRTIKKEKMLELIRNNSKAANSLVAHRLARVLLRLAHLDEDGPASLEIPNPSHQVLAEMVGTTRPRINFFMNRFRKQGFVQYDGGLEVHQSLRKILRKPKNRL